MNRRDTETICHCGAGYNGSDHCPECYCEQYETGDCEHVALAITESRAATEGQNARRGDLVRNLTTGELGYVICGTNGGRVLVGSRPDSAGYAKWERYNITIEAQQGELI